MTGPVIMVDGINLDVPAIHARWPHNPVAVPVDGMWAWSPAQDHLFARKIHYGVLAADVPQLAHRARCLDIEARLRVGGDAGARDAGPFLAERAKVARDGTIYCNLATVPAVVEAAGGASAAPRWWLAWYWQRAGEPTRAQVLAELHALTGVTLEPGRLWACQYGAFGSWDLSIVYGPQDWSA